MRLHVLSDLHMEGRPFTLPDVDADVLVLAGDITTLRKHGLGILHGWAQSRLVIYVPGNHEYYYGTYPNETFPYANANRRLNEQESLVLLQNGEHRIGNVRFLGCTLWTDFDLYGNSTKAMREAEHWMSDYKYIRWQATSGSDRGLLPDDTRNAHRNSVNWLKRKLWDDKWSGQTVVITHHLPSVQSISLKYIGADLNPAFASNLDYLFPSVDLWIHGHTHTAIRYESDGCRVVCNPRGYNGEDSEYDSRLVVEV